MSKQGADKDRTDKDRTDKNRLLESSIDWELPEKEFIDQIRDMILKSVREEAAITLPILLHGAGDLVETLSLINSQIDCNGCDARCCKYNPGNHPTAITLKEYEMIKRKFGHHDFNVEGGFAHIPMPCPFLEDSRCTIYSDRPFMCYMFPFQPGGSVEGIGTKEVPAVSLSAACPEARRIAERVYMQFREARSRVLSTFYPDGVK